ncbi:MAG: STAS domain-containing protein [Terrabacter sp.]|nr:STAS domain-containing protein [Terrabacter sp.]
MPTAFLITGSPPSAHLRIMGDLDLATRDRLREVIEDLQDTGYERIDLDLAAVGFIDASNLGVLRQQQRRLLASGGALDVVAASHRHQRVVRLVGYDTLLAPGPDPRATGASST